MPSSYTLSLKYSFVVATSEPPIEEREDEEEEEVEAEEGKEKVVEPVVESSGEPEPTAEADILIETDSTKESARPEEEEDSSLSPVTASHPDDKVSYSIQQVSSMLRCST